MANGLYAAIAEGGKPIQLENPLNQMARLAALRGAEQEQQLNALKMAEAEREFEARNQLRQFLPSVTAENRAQLLGFGAPGRQAYETLLKGEKESREAERAAADIAATRMQQARDLLPAVNSPEAYANWRTYTLQNLPGLANIIPEQYSPEVKQNLMLRADKALEQHFVTQNLGGATRVIGVPRFGQGPAAVVPGSEARMTMAPGEAQRLDIDRGRLGLERERVGLERQRLNLAGTEGLSPKEVQKREAAFPQATQSVKAIEAKSDSFINDLRALRDHPGLSEITGFVAGRIPGLTADGRAAQAIYDKVTAKGGFQALQDMRDASKTGGALGNVSNREGQQLVASFAAIDRRQDARDVRAAIDQAIGDIEGSKTRIREAYDLTYSYKKPSSEAVSPTPAPTPAPTPGRPLSPIDQQALNWARANPKDPRAQQIKDRLGVPR